MRLGGGIDGREWKTPQEWLQIVKEMEYEAVFCPVDSHASVTLRQEFKKLIRENDLYLGEVGAWANPLAENADERKKISVIVRNSLHWQKKWKLPVVSILSDAVEKYGMVPMKIITQMIPMLWQWTVFVKLLTVSDPSILFIP